MASPEEATSEQRRVGSDLLMRKLPLLARAHAMAQQNPQDPSAECNLLCYGPDIYRIHSMVCRLREDNAAARGNDGDHDDDEEIKKREHMAQNLDAMVALPTRMPFLALIESELRKSTAPPQREVKKDSEKETGDVKNGRRASSSADKHSTDRKKMKMHDGEGDEEEDGEEEERGNADRSARENSTEYSAHDEESVLLRAIREPLPAPRAGDKTSRAAEAVGFRNTNGSNKTNGSSDSTRCIRWEYMLKGIMSRSSVNDDGGNDNDNDYYDDKSGDSVRSYLRRVSWIEQQKKIQTGHRAAAESHHHDEQLWVSMTDAMRVQKEMRRMRLQRKRFRRPHKTKGQ